MNQTSSSDGLAQFFLGHEHACAIDARYECARLLYKREKIFLPCDDWGQSPQLARPHISNENCPLTSEMRHAAQAAFDEW
jgi:hypothetical protein